jgi:hypothetical protein
MHCEKHFSRTNPDGVFGTASAALAMLSARNQGADIAILLDAGQCLEAFGEGDHIMSTIFNELRHDSLSRAVPRLIRLGLHQPVDGPDRRARHDKGLKVLAPLLVGRILAYRLEEPFEVGQALHGMIDLNSCFARAERAGEDFHIHLVGAGLAADFAQPALREVDDVLLLPEAGVDLPACYEYVRLPCATVFRRSC